MVRNLVAVVLVGCCALLVAGCATAPTEPKAAVPPADIETPSAPAEAPVTGPAKVGDSLTSGPWGFSISETYVKNEAPGQVPAPEGKELLYVQVQLSNNGQTTLEIDPADFSMKDASGATLETFGKRQAYNALDMTPLEPGYGTSTAFIYAVDPGATGFTFAFAPKGQGAGEPMEVQVP